MNPFAALGRFVVRYRWLVLVAWLVVVPLAAKTLPTLSSVSKNDNTAFLPASSLSQKAQTLATPFTPKGQGSAVLVAERSDGALGAADEAAISRAESAIGKLAVVRAVLDRGQSADQHAQEVNIELRLSAFGNGDADNKAVDTIRADMARADPPPGLALHLTGDIAIAVDEQRAANRGQGLTQEFAILFIIVLLFVVFRALLAPFVTLIPAAMALALAEPIIAESTKIGVQVSDLLSLLLVVVVLGAGVDYGLFLIFRMREEMRGGRPVKEAVAVSLQRVGESITFSALTVIAALVSLLLASFGLYKGLGPGLAIGIAVVLLANLTLLPALLAILGKAVFWPLIPKPGAERRTFWGTVAGRVVHRPLVTLGIALVLFGGLALSLLDYSSAGFGAPTVPATSDSSAGTAVLTAHFAKADANPTVVIFKFATPVWQNPSVIDTAQRALAQKKVFNGVVGALDPIGGSTQYPPSELALAYQALGPPQALPLSPSPAVTAQLAADNIPAQLYQLYRAEAQFVSRDGRTIEYFTTLTSGDPGNAPALHAVPAIRAAVSSVAAEVGATDSGVAGEAPAIADVASVSTSDLEHIIPVVLVVLALLLAIVLRSLIAPTYLVLSVGLSYLASLGFATLAFAIIGGQDGINFVLPFFMFIFIMALGEDYNILVTSRIREEAHSLKLRDAVQRAVERTGTTVTSAGLILAGTFIALTVAGGKQVEEIGVGLAFGVLLDTFFVRTLVVPSMVVLVGRWNWWPARLFYEEADEDRTFSDQLAAVD